MINPKFQELIQKQIITDIDKIIKEQEKKWNNEQYYFDCKEALRFYKFACKMPLDKGKKGELLKPLKFQYEICTDILCVKRKKDDLRRFREAHINCPRKQGKSFIVGLILTYLFFFKPVYGCEYIITANTTKQAGLLYKTIKNFIKNTPLKMMCKITDSLKEIYREDQNITLRVLSSNGSNLDSYCAAAFCMDEIHELQDNSAYDKLKTGQGILDEPLGITITTASNGKDDTNLEYELYNYSKGIEYEEFKDDSFYYRIYEAEENCNINDMEQYFKSNPALGHFRKLEDIKLLALRATQVKSRENAFRRLYLNQHVSLIVENAINQQLWKRSLENVNEMDYRNKCLCCAGLDYGQVSDFTAYVKCYYDEIKDKYIIIPQIYTATGVIETFEDKEQQRLKRFIHNGDLIELKTSHVLLKDVKAELLKDKDILEEVAYDEWKLQSTMINIQDEIKCLVNFRQGFKTMSPAIRRFEELLLEGKLIIQDNKCLTWQSGNVTAVTDDAENIKYSKKKSKNKIDAIIAMIMALSRCDALVNDPYSSENISRHYEQNYSM
ncbi:terminase TerL endonuclease subunit [Clostridium sporogenes]|uniref:terminase TerL endonuclease subunit n=1 Tax=Clostridium sporogenes TaxID=1509 RepID=UPI00024BA9E6|nr:terminase TerL endonuclease subunit [Clostridium sporogenes]EHN13121.1 terminase [Clostridium sporogenes PA 3679]MDU4597894.1 terminase TerL endonuclease subunit [Clostridium sporogenes]NFQ35069.1 terminase large subunit [Clostridium sporogenes]NFQ60897.1 terminase large subunit [Clostridium sporogenes]NFU11258.1 terminase large subunit [Clostridium sporogenes]